MSKALLTDAAIATTKAVVEKLNIRDEERADAFRELLPVVREGLEKYAQQQGLLFRRMFPLVFGRVEGKEGEN